MIFLIIEFCITKLVSVKTITLKTEMIYAENVITNVEIVLGLLHRVSLAVKPIELTTEYATVSQDGSKILPVNYAKNATLNAPPV